ncbi:MAG: hypothetical protein KIT22_00510 [Verrucomicrobiae bacterium]|nr:hypothetical protein [Verrucomicrobiae bacterium]
MNDTEVPHLSVVCCGKLPGNPSERLASARMRQFFREAAQSYDRIIVDCPPVSAVADPLIVGALTDGMIFVTKFNRCAGIPCSVRCSGCRTPGFHCGCGDQRRIDFEGRHAYCDDFRYHQNKYYASHYADAAGAGRARNTFPRDRPGLSGAGADSTGSGRVGSGGWREEPGAAKREVEPQPEG